MTIGCERDDVEWQHSAMFKSFNPHEPVESTENFRRRIECVSIIHQIPDSGIAEALESLVGIEEYYRALPAQAATKSIVFDRAAVMGDRTTVLPFPINDEE